MADKASRFVFSLESGYEVFVQEGYKMLLSNPPESEVNRFLNAFKMVFRQLDLETWVLDQNWKSTTDNKLVKMILIEYTLKNCTKRLEALRKYHTNPIPSPQVINDRVIDQKDSMNI